VTDSRPVFSTQFVSVVKKFNRADPTTTATPPRPHRNPSPGGRAAAGPLRGRPPPPPEIGDLRAVGRGPTTSRSVSRPEGAHRSAPTAPPSD